MHTQTGTSSVSWVRHGYQGWTKVWHMSDAMSGATLDSRLSTLDSANSGTM